MPESTRDANPAQDDDIIDDDNEWVDDAADDSGFQDQAKAASQNLPKWKAIEDYWERKRLRNELQDYLTDEE